MSVRFEQLLDDYFSNERASANELSSVKYFSDKLHLSAKYLSELLWVSTGQSAQQHKRNKVNEVAKIFLAATSLSVAEIAYQLGFERPQSLN